MTSLFLSYARDDDEPFVRRLYQDLTAHGFDVWFDRVSMPARQLSFTQEIKDALAGRDRLVLVVGPEAAVRPYVLKEWGEALLMDKCVNPIVRLDGQQADGTPLDGLTLVPEEFNFIHVEDFRRDSEYPEHLENLVRQLSDPAPPLGKLVAVPTLPSHYRAQPDRLRSLRDALLIDLRGPVVVTGAAARIGVQGMGGIGKSVLANALARDLQVRRAFPDGILWIPVGQQPTIVELQRQVATALGDEALFNDVHAGKEKLRALLANRAALLVLDDVWRRGAADAFDALGPRCKLLLTTRDAGLVISMAGTHYQVQLPTEAEALALLASAAHLAVESLPAQATDVVRECGRLPLALALCGGMVQAGTSLRDLLDALSEHDLEFLSDEHAAEDQHRNVWRAMEVSVRVLPEDQQWRFAELAVFAVGARVPEAAVLTLWVHTGGLSERRARRLLVELSQRSLVQLDRRTGAEADESATVGLHDLLHDFATRLAERRFGTVAALHEQLVEAYRRKCSNDWPSGPNDGYFFDHLRDHLVEAGKVDELCRLLLDLTWLQNKAEVGLIFDLPRDYVECLRMCPADDSRRHNIRLLEQALRRDIHFIARHPGALFQCFWNSGWWYDCAEAAQHYESADGPWNRPGDKLSALLEAWRAEKERATPGFVWVRAKRPPPTSLDSGELAVLRGHEYPVSSVAVTANGGRIISGSWDKTVRVWDGASGAELSVLRGHKDLVSSVAVTTDGGRIISGSWDKTVRVWDGTRGAELAVLCGHEHVVTSVATTRDGGRVISGSGDKTVRVWDGASGAELAVLRGHEDIVCAVAVTPDGKRIITGSSDKTVRVWDGTSGAALEVLRHEYPVTSVAVSSDGSRIISGSWDTVRVWDSTSGVELAVLRGHEHIVNDVAVTSDGSRIISGSSDKGVRVWDAKSGAALAVLRGHKHVVDGVAVTSDGDRVISGSWDFTVRVWNGASGPKPTVLRGREDGERGADDRVTSVAVTVDWGRVISGSGDHTVRVSDCASGAELAVLRGHEAPVMTVAVTPDGKQIVSGSQDQTVRVWDGTSGAELLVLRGRGSVNSVAVTPDRRRIVSADDAVRVWDGTTGAELSLNWGSRARSVAVTPDGRRIISGSVNRTVRLIDAATGAELAEFHGHKGVVTSVAVTPDGARIISGSEDRTVRMWDAATGACLEVIQGDGDLVAIGTGVIRYPYRALAHGSETVIEKSASGQEVARFPEALSHLSTHPFGRAWVGASGNHLYFITLEGDE